MPEVKQSAGLIINWCKRRKCFDVELLQQAYAQEFTPFFTDDASVVEAMGMPVYLAEGNRENIKITTPFDLKVGSALL